MLRHFKAVLTLFCGILILSSCGPYEGSRYSAYYESDDYYSGYSNNIGPFYPGYSWYQFGIGWTSPVFYHGYHDHWYDARRYSYRYAPPPPPMRPYYMRPRPYDDRRDDRDYARHRYQRDRYRQNMGGDDRYPSRHDNDRRPWDGSHNDNRPGMKPPFNEGNGNNSNRPPQRPDRDHVVNRPPQQQPDSERVVNRLQGRQRSDGEQVIDRLRSGSSQDRSREANRGERPQQKREERPNKRSDRQRSEQNQQQN